MIPLRRSAFALILVIAPAWADQPNPSFYLVNRAKQPIVEAYASPVSAEGWGRNRLDDNVAPNGNAAVRLLADGNCMFDLRVVFEDGHDEQRRAVNICNLDNIAFGAPARPTPVPNGNPERDPSFRIVNTGDRDIDEVYARIAGAAGWGRDRLGDDTIDGGSYKVIQLPHGQCLWDLRLVFADGQTTERRRVNLCEVTDLPVQ